MKMKNLDLNKYGVQEMNAEEMQKKCRKPTEDFFPL